MYVSPKHPDYECLVGARTTTPPEPTGEVLASFKRTIATGPQQELRVSLDSFEGHPYISIRVWEGKSGAWWPTKKGTSVRLSEAQGVAEALLAATELAPPKVEAPPPRRAPKGQGRSRARLEPAEATPSLPWRPDPDLVGAEWL